MNDIWNQNYISMPLCFNKYTTLENVTSQFNVYLMFKRKKRFDMALILMPKLSNYKRYYELLQKCHCQHPINWIVNLKIITPFEYFFITTSNVPFFARSCFFHFLELFCNKTLPKNNQFVDFSF